MVVKSGIKGWEMVISMQYDCIRVDRVVDVS